MKLRSYVYFNLFTKTWSERVKGKVVGHDRVIYLEDARFLVAKAGRDRVRREGKKNVHAGVSGVRRHLEAFYGPIKMDAWRTEGDWVRVTYDPYKYDSFVVAGSGERIDSAAWVWMKAEDGKPPEVWAKEAA